MGNRIVIVPTYNESENTEKIIQESILLVYIDLTCSSLMITLLTAQLPSLKIYKTISQTGYSCWKEQVNWVWVPLILQDSNGPLT